MPIPCIGSVDTALLINGAKDLASKALVSFSSCPTVQPSE